MARLFPCSSVLVLMNCLLGHHPLLQAQSTCPPNTTDPNCSTPFLYDNGQGGTMPYRLFGPGRALAAGEKIPLVVFLHGAGERGTDNVAQVGTNMYGLLDATRSPEYSSFLVAPQLPSGGWRESSSVDFTRQIIDDVLSDYPIDTDRLYLTGLSLGGFGTTRYVRDNPDLFAAAVPIAGAANFSLADMATIKDVPFWLFHGDQDGVVDVERSRNFVAEMRQVGGDPLYNEIARGRHNVWNRVYADRSTQEFGLYDWLYSQTLAVPEPSSGVIFSLFAALGLVRRGRRNA
jgi:predicted peptidase